MLRNSLRTIRIRFDVLKIKRSNDLNFVNDLEASYRSFED